jgi:2-isopropylmalate synthase
MGGLVRDYPGGHFGFHGHTDRGFGVANARAAILAGAVHIQGTMIGTGERCGNVNLTTVIGSMQLRGEAEFVSPESLRGSPAWRIRRTGGSTTHGAPIVGPGAFNVADAWVQRRKNPELTCGAIRRRRQPVIGVNAQSGRANVVLLSEALGSAERCASSSLIEANQP